MKKINIFCFWVGPKNPKNAYIIYGPSLTQIFWDQNQPSCKFSSKPSEKTSFSFKSENFHNTHVLMNSKKMFMCSLILLKNWLSAHERKCLKIQIFICVCHEINEFCQISRRLSRWIAKLEIISWKIDFLTMKIHKI